MKRKIRVVSIILCTAMLIGLLPAEQVFAADVDITPSLGRLGFAENAKAIAISFGDKVNSEQVYDYTYDGASGGSWSENNNLEKTLSVGGSADNLRSMLASTEHLKKEQGSRCWYNNLGDAASSWYCVKEKDTPVTWSNTNVLNRMNNLLLGQSVLMDASSLLDYLVSPEEEGGLAFIDGNIGVYSVECFWIDSKFTDSNIYDWTSGTNRSWYYQRITCDYNAEYDTFVYNLVGILQDQGSDNLYVIAQYCSKYLIEFGVLPYNNETNETVDIKNMHDKYLPIIDKFWNNENYLLSIQETLKDIYDENVQLASREEKLENPVITINNVLSLQDNKTVGAPWVESVGLDYYLGIFLVSDTLRTKLNNTTLGCNMYTSVRSDDRGVSEFYVRYKTRAHIVKWYYPGDQSLTDYDVPVQHVERFIKMGNKFPEYVVGASTASITHGKDFVGIDSYDMNIPPNCNVNSTINNGTSPGYVDSRQIDKGSVSISTVTWQAELSKSIDISGEGWATIIKGAYSMYSAIISDDVNFSYSGSSDPFKISSEEPPPHPPTAKSYPFYEAMKYIADLVTLADYKSDSGARIALGLEQIISDGKIIIDYTPNSNMQSELNWKTVLNKEFGGDHLKISTASDLVYCLMYLEYLRTNQGYNFPLHSVEIIVSDTKKYTLLYSDEARVSFPMTLGYFWDSENQLGRCLPKSSESWDYVDSVSHAFTNLSLIGLMSTGAELDIKKTLNTSYAKLTGAGAFGSGSRVNPNVDTSSDAGIYAIFGFTEDEVDKAKTRLSDIIGNELFTGNVMGALSDAQYMYVYSTQLSVGQIGVNSITGLESYAKWNYFCNSVYSRADRLEGTKYADESDASLDYFPRLPILDVEFPDAVYNLLYNVEYAAAVCDWSSLSDDMGIDVSTMENFLFSSNMANVDSVAETMKSKLRSAYEKYKTSNLTVENWAKAGVYDGMNDDYMGILRAIVNIHNLCDLLYSANYAFLNGGALPTEINGKGVDIAKNWSPVIYGYYMIYQKDADLFDALSANLVKYTGGEFSYSTPIEPLGFVIKFEDEQLSAQWKYGYALSSMYVPFQTNVYEVAAIEEKADDAEWVTNFYYKYGFYRKALYITTDPDAVVNRYTAGIQSGTKVATLRDLLNYNRDIELYVDQGFYNGDLLEEQLDRFIQNTNEGSVFGSIYDACNLTPDAILKDGGYATYSSAIQAKVRPFGYEIAEAEKEEAAKMFAYEDFILSEDEILGEDGMLSAYEYSIQQPYGLVSAMYRSGTLFNKANQASVQNEPVFVSSKNANAIGSYNKDLYRSFYNYLMLSAIEETIERETTLLVDLDAPIFIDIFGNILTSDGYVIIPAAANPTLVGKDWVPYTLGFATYVNNADPSVFKNMTYEFYDFLYGINYAAAIGKSDIDTYSPNFRDNQKKIGGGYFFLRQNGTSTLGTTNLTDGVASTTVNWDNPNTHVAALKNLLFSVHYLNTADMYSMTTVNMILEVLRGAPIEFIDYTEEGITTTHALTKGGATVAYMSEQLLNSVQTDSNGTERNAKFSATLNVLDLFHIESAEKVALLAVKLLLIGFLILLAVQIIADASVGKMPVKTVGRIIVTCVLTGTCTSLLPVLTEFSLSKLTQMFLQPEAAELLAMQAQRDSYGIEIGITESYNTESSTDIIVKVGELDVQWYDLLLYSVYSSIDDSFTDLYTEAADGLPLAEASYTFTSGKNIYMDLGKIMDSTVVQYNGELGLITNERTREMSDDDMSASYLFPYYVFLDQLVANVNLYNKTNGVQPLSYNINSDGSIRTQDMTYAYFHSTEFMTTDYDILDLYRILNINTYKLSYCPYFSDDDLVTMGGSLWYPTNTDTDTLTASVELLYQSARDYVANNSSMLSYVSDGAFLKSLAMYLAVEYNSIFGVGTADAFELKCVDTKDMLRYVVSHPKDVYKYATRSFSRYAFEVGDVWGAILATALYVIMCVTNAIKVVAYVLTYVTAVWSIIYHRVFKRESDYSVYGFFILIGEITILNVIYSASLKVMMNLTRWGMPGLAALGVSILLQGGIIIGFLLLCFNGVKNVKNLGQKEIHRIQTIINNLNRDRSSNTNDNPNQPERTVAVLQAHDFSRRELDNYNGDRANVADLLAHDRRREMGQIGQEATES